MEGVPIPGGVHNVPDLSRVFLDVPLEFRCQRGVACWYAVVRRALENGEMGGRLGDHWCCLNTSGAGADLANPFAGEVHPLVRPLHGVVPASLEALEPGDAWHIRRGQAADGGN